MSVNKNSEYIINERRIVANREHFLKHNDCKQEDVTNYMTKKEERKKRKKYKADDDIIAKENNPSMLMYYVYYT